MLIPDDGRMKPIMLLPPETIDDEGIKLLRENGLCVVVAKDPARVKFLDPIPSIAQRTKIEDTAIRLSRKLLDRDTFVGGSPGYAKSFSRSEIAQMFVDLLVAGTPL